ncbi:MAG: SDR family oxidoreductase [Planctomycetota bacterium]
MSDSRTVVVTGCTKGLGRALVAGLIGEGVRVIGCGRTSEAIGQLEARFPGEHRWDTVDVSDDSAVASWAAASIASHGAPDLVINNAAVIHRSAPLWEISAEEFDRLTAININGVQNVVRRFAPAMLSAGRGVFAHLSSGWGRSTSPDVGGYCTSKWAIEGYARSLADDLPAGLGSVAVNPGIIDTEMLRSCFGDAAGHHESPEEWASRAVPFFLGLEPRHNGQALTV